MTFLATLRANFTAGQIKGDLAWVAKIRETARQRRRLAELEPHLLDDIGLTDSEVAREVSRPIWDVPSHWRM